jgi:hypothetical protein
VLEEKDPTTAGDVTKCDKDAVTAWLEGLTGQTDEIQTALGNRSKKKEKRKGIQEVNE